MLALRCNEYGPPESLLIEAVADPEAGPGEAVVKVEAAAVNYPDVLIVANRYQVSVPPPFTPGSEYAGRVLSVGPGVTDVAPGDAVRGTCMVGAFAQQVVSPVSSLTLMPPGASFVAAASYQVVYATAYHALRSVADCRAGEWVAVLGAAGGVGLAAVDLAHLLGARVLAAASSPAKLAACAARGADALVDYDKEDLKVRMRDLTDGGADVVIDPVGGRYSEAALRSTRWGGRFVTVGFASGEIPRIPLNLVLLKGAIVKGFEIRSFGSYAPDLAARDQAELAELWQSGRIDPYVKSVYPLERSSDALIEVAERRAIGKVVIDLAPGPAAGPAPASSVG